VTVGQTASRRVNFFAKFYDVFIWPSCATEANLQKVQGERSVGKLMQVQFE